MVSLGHMLKRIVRCFLASSYFTNVLSSIILMGNYFIGTKEKEKSSINGMAKASVFFDHGCETPSGAVLTYKFINKCVNPLPGILGSPRFY